MKITSQHNVKPCLSDEIAMHFPKIHRIVLCKVAIGILIVFLRCSWRQSVRKKFRQKYGLFMQNKYLYINSRNSCRLNRSSKTFCTNGSLSVFLNWMRWDKYLYLILFLFERVIKVFKLTLIFFLKNQPLLQVE